MSLSTRSNEEKILMLEKELRKLREQSKPQTSISINGEYKSRGTSQGETRARRDSIDRSPSSPTGDPEMHIEELLSNPGGTGARDPRQNVNAIRTPSERKDTRVSMNPVVLSCPDIEPGEIVSSADEHQARRDRRKTLVNDHVSSKSKSRDSNKPKQTTFAVDPRSAKNPKENVVVNVSRRDSRRVNSSPEVEQLRTENRPIFHNTGASCSRDEYIRIPATEESTFRNDSTTTSAVSAPETSTNTAPQSQSVSSLETKQSRKRKQRNSSETAHETTQRKKSSSISEVNLEDDSENILFDRKEALLKALGDDLSLSGLSIHQSLVPKWTSILQKGLDDNSKETLIKEYYTPANCKFLKAPVLNEEISIVADFQARNRDKILENKQNQLGLGITGIARAITALLNRGENYEFDAMTHLNRGCRLLLDLHHTETKSRRHLFKKDLGRSDVFKNLDIHQLDRDDTLFGHKLAKMIKKQGIPMTPLRPARYRDSGTFSRRHYNEPSSPRRSN